MSGGYFNDRIVTFTEMKLGDGNWYFEPAPLGFIRYSFILSEGQEYSSVTITRSDGKALTIDITRETGGNFEFDICDNVIKFSSARGMHADMPFQ
jgi:hypothetical protein